MAPFVDQTPDGGTWRPWLSGAVEAVRLRASVLVEGEQGLPTAEDNQRIILCLKHQSTWETFFLWPNAPSFSLRFKRELLYILFFGWAMACLNMIVLTEAPEVMRGARSPRWAKCSWIAASGSSCSLRHAPSAAHRGSDRCGPTRDCDRRKHVTGRVSACWPRKVYLYTRHGCRPLVRPSRRLLAKRCRFDGKGVDWIEEEMRRIDPDAYPESERPLDPLKQEATLSAALEAQAAAARAAQGGLSDDNA